MCVCVCVVRVCECGGVSSHKDTVSPRKEDLSSEQLRHDTTHRPHVHLLVIVHPVEHDLRSTPVPRCHVAGHLVVRGLR